MNPATGHVVAMVGGRDFTESRFNRATQAKRQSGSAFKPFVFAAALEAGFSPATVITGLDDPIETLQGKWVPEDEHSSASSMTMRTALKTSSNRAAVQMLNTVGIAKAVGAAEKLNVGTPPSVPSLALGTSDVTLMSLTAAYGAFAAEGVVRPPVLIRKVEDSDGNVLYQDEQKSAQAVSKATAYLMSSMLADVVNHGTGYRARQSGFTMPAAGKTGTTNDYVDAWFVGYHATGRDRRVDRVRSAADDHFERLRRRARGADVGQLHEGRDQGPQAGLVRATRRRGRRQRVPRLWQAAERGLRHRRGAFEGRLRRDSLDDLHRILCEGLAAVGDLPAAPAPRIPRPDRRRLRRRTTRRGRSRPRTSGSHPRSRPARPVPAPLPPSAPNAPAPAKADENKKDKKPRVLVAPVRQGRRKTRRRIRPRRSPAAEF